MNKIYLKKLKKTSIRTRANHFISDLQRIIHLLSLLTGNNLLQELLSGNSKERVKTGN